MRTNALLAIGLLALAGVGGSLVLHDQAQAPAATTDVPAPPADTPLPRSLKVTENSVLPARRPVRQVELPYYVLHETENDVLLSRRATTLSAAGTPSMWRQAHTALVAVEKYPRQDGTFRNPLPPGARVLGVHIVNGLATVDLSPAFRDNFNGGAREEQMTIYALVNTVGHIPGVRGVKFSIAGQPIDEFAGHLDLSDPLTPDDTIVEPSREPSAEAAH